MEKRWCLVLMFFISQFGMAQQTADKQLTEPVQKINLLYPGFEKEKPLSKKMTWGYTLGTRFWYSVGLYPDGDNSSRWDFDFIDLVPSGELYSRWYYNLAKRDRKHKKIVNNSSSYFTVGSAVYFSGINLKGEGNPYGDEFIAGLYGGWGWRRTFGQRIIFDMHLKVQPTVNHEGDCDIFFMPGVYIGYKLIR